MPDSTLFGFAPRFSLIVGQVLGISALTLTLACAEEYECGGDASCTTTGGEELPGSSSGPGTTAVSGSASMTSTSGSGETSATGDSSSGDTSGASGSSDGSDSGSGSSSGSGSEDSSGGSGSSTTTGAFGCEGRPIVDLDSAVAIAYGDLPPLPGGGMSTSTTGGGDGGGVPDDTLSLRLSNTPLTCEAPRADTSCGPQRKWSVVIGIPFELQEPGAYSFEDLSVSYSIVEAGVGENCAGGGGGGFTDGTLIIESIDASGLVACIVDAELFDVDANGTFSAEHCSAG